MGFGIGRNKRRTFANSISGKYIWLSWRCGRIDCGNYLYLSQKLDDTGDAASRVAFLDAVANGSAISCSTSTYSASMISQMTSCRTR